MASRLDIRQLQVGISFIVHHGSSLNQRCAIKSTLTFRSGFLFDMESPHEQWYS